MKRTTVLRKTTIPAFAGGASARTANQSSKERRIRSMARQSLVVAAVALGISGVAQAANDCTLKTLNGPYVFTASGYNVVAGVAQPKAIVELINFNGDGTLSVPAATRSVNGTIARTPPGGTGTYTVDAGCTGKIAFKDGPGFDVFISPRGEKVWMIQTDSGTVFQGTSESAQAADQLCSNETLKGTYGLAIGGTRPAPFVPVGAPGYVGQFEQVLGTVIQIFDGKGNFTQVDNVKGTIAGIVPDRPGRGTYNVNPDCSVTQVVSPPGQAQIVSKGVIMDGGREFRQNTVTPDSFMISAIGRKLN
jgi:hypothetical protein